MIICKGVKVTNLLIKRKVAFEEVGKYVNKLKSTPTRDLSILEIKELLEIGNLMLWGTYKDGTKDYSSLNGYLGTDFIVLDVDNKEVFRSFEEVVNDFYNLFNAKPLLYYYSFSDKGTHTRFRIIYKLDGFLKHSLVNYKGNPTPIYKIIMENIVNKYPYIDSCCMKPQQYYYGTNTEVFINKDYEPIKLQDLRHLYKKIIEEDRKEQYRKMLQQKKRKEELRKKQAKQKGKYTNIINFDTKIECMKDLNTKVNLMEVLQDFNIKCKKEGNGLKFENPWYKGNRTMSATCYEHHIIDWSNGGKKRDLLDLLQEFYSTDVIKCIEFVRDRYGISIPDEFLFKKSK